MDYENGDVMERFKVKLIRENKELKSSDKMEM